MTVSTQSEFITVVIHSQTIIILHPIITNAPPHPLQQIGQVEYYLQYSPEINELERNLFPVKILVKNIENKKS